MDQSAKVLHSIELKKKDVGQKKIQDGRLKIQDGRHKNQFLQICSSEVNICDKLKEHKSFITF